jgi:hypothetical protein
LGSITRLTATSTFISAPPMGFAAERWEFYRNNPPREMGAGV